MSWILTDEDIEWRYDTGYWNDTDYEFPAINEMTKPIPKLIIPIGLPGSGKSSDAPKDCKVLGKDHIRFMLLNYNNTGRDFDPGLEFLIDEIERFIFNRLLDLGYNIYVDECNLTEKRRLSFVIPAKRKDYHIEYVVYSEYWKAIENNRMRTRTVPMDIIAEMIEKYEPPTHKEREIVNKIITDVEL